MATASKTWTWNSDLESWVATSDGDANAQRDASNGSPNAGSLQMYLTPGRTQSGHGYFDLDASWSSIFGISSSVTVTKIQVTDVRSYIGLTHWVPSATPQAWFYVFCDQCATNLYYRGSSTQDSAWVDGAAGTLTDLTTPVLASSTANLQVDLYASTGNTANSTISVHVDYLTIEVTYESIKQGTSSPVACAVASATASRTRARTVEAVAAVEATATGTKPSGSTKDGTANVVCCAVTAAGSTKPARTSPVVATVASATASRTRARTVEAVCCAVAEGSRQRTRARTVEAVAVAVASATGRATKSGSASAVSVAVASATGSNTTVPAWTLTDRGQPVYSDLTPGGKAEFSGVTEQGINTYSGGGGGGGTTKQGTANVACCAVASAGSTKPGRATPVAVAVASAGSVKPARSSPVACAVATAAGARIRSRTASVVIVAVATAGSTKPARASVVAVASTGGQTTDNFYVASGSDDGYLQCSSATYADARDGVGTKTLVDGLVLDTGQRFSSSTYSVYESFLAYNTAGLPDDASISSATFWFCGWTSGADQSATDFSFEIRLYDWSSGGLTTADFVPGANLGGYTLLASRNTADGFPDDTWSSWTSEAALLTNINKTGKTYVFASSSRTRGNETPTGLEYLRPSAYDRGSQYASYLAITYSTGTQGQRVRQRTAEAIAAVEATATGSKETGGTTKQGTASVVAVAVASEAHLRTRERTASVVSATVAGAGSVKPAHVAPVACVVVSEAHARIRSRTVPDCVVAVAATATGEKAGGAKNGTANVFAVGVASEAHLRIRARTATIVACAVASAGSVKPARSSIVTCALTGETRIRVRARTASVVGVALATAGSTKPARSTPVVATVATAAGQRIRSRTAALVVCAVASAYAAEIEANTAAIVVATVATANGSRIRLATSAPVAVAVASAASVKPARSSIVCCTVATATGSKGGYKYATAEVAAAVVATASSVKPARSSVVSACVATATGAAVKLATASIVACAAATAAGKNICAVTFTEPHDDDRYEYGSGGQIAWTCTPVSGVTFHLYAVYRGTAVQYWLKDVAADGSGSYSTADDFNVPPGQYRMTVVVT